MNESPHKSKSGLGRIAQAFGYSCAGLKMAWSESAFRQEVALSCIMLPVAVLVPVSAAERALLVGSVLLILLIELVNSAIEAVVDRVSLEEHMLAKRAKDLGSAAVLLCFVNLACVWSLILWPLL